MSLMGGRPKLIRWEPDPAVDRPFVWVSIAKFDLAWSSDGLYIGPNGAGDDQPYKIERTKEWFARFDTSWMPQARLAQDGIPCFIDGRHRFVWVRENGARAIPVMIDPAFQAEMQRRFGSRIRQCRVWPEALG